MAKRRRRKTRSKWQIPFPETRRVKEGLLITKCYRLATLWARWVRTVSRVELLCIPSHSNFSSNVEKSHHSLNRNSSSMRLTKTAKIKASPRLTLKRSRLMRPETSSTLNFAMTALKVRMWIVAAFTYKTIILIQMELPLRRSDSYRVTLRWYTIRK